MRSTVSDLVDNARANLEIARRLVLMGCGGFGASSAQLTMRLLAAALLFERTGKMHSDPRILAAELRRVFEGQLDAAVIQHVEDSASLELGPETVDYHPPPSIDRARDEVNRAQAFLGDVVGILRLPPETARISTPPASR